MRITDYEGGRTLRDVAITLTAEEAQELADYLRRLVSRPAVRHAHLSALTGAQLDQELTISIVGQKESAA